MIEKSGRSNEKLEKHVHERFKKKIGKMIENLEEVTKN